MPKPNAEILKTIQSHPFAIESLDYAQRTDSEIVFRAFEKNFKTIESIHPVVKKDKRIMERLVRHRNSAFSYADDSLRRDKGYVLDLLSKKTNILEFVHSSLKKDREVVLSAVRNAGWALRHVDECLKNDDEIVKEAIASDICFVSYAGSQFQAKHQDIVHRAIVKEPRLIEYLNDSWYSNPESVVKVIMENFEVIKFVLPIVRKNKKIMEGITRNNMAFQYADDSLKKDRDFVIDLLRKKRPIFRFIYKALQKDREVVLLAVKYDGSALEYADVSLQKDREVVLSAVNTNGCSLVHADKLFQKDKDVVLVAVHNNGYAFRYVDDCLKNDEEVVNHALAHDVSLIEYAGLEFQLKHREILYKAMQRNHHLFRHLGPSLKKDKEIALRAVRGCACVYQDVDHSIRGDFDIVEEALKTNRSNIRNVPDSTFIKLNLKPNGSGGFDIEKKDFNQVEELFRSGKVFKDISFAYDRDHHFVHECFGKIRELMGRPYEIKCDNHEGLEGEIRETFTHKVPVEYYAMRQSGGYCDRRHKSIYLRKTDETESKKKEYFVPLDDHIEFEVTVSIKAKARYNSEKTIEVSEEELSP